MRIPTVVLLFVALILPAASQIVVEVNIQTNVPAEWAELLIPIQAFGETKEEAEETLQESITEVEAVLKAAQLKDDRIERSQVSTFVGGDPRSRLRLRLDQTLKVELTDPSEFAGLARKLHKTPAEVSSPKFNIRERLLGDDPFRRSGIEAAGEKAAFIAAALGIELGNLTEFAESKETLQWASSINEQNRFQGEFNQSSQSPGRAIRGLNAPNFELDVPVAAFMPPLVTRSSTVEMSYGEAVDRAILVDGSAKTNVIPNKVTLTFMVKGEGKSEDRAVEKLKAHVLALETRLRAEKGLAEDRLFFEPVNTSEQTSKSTFSKGKGTTPTRMISFLATMRISCELLDLSTLPTLQQDLAEMRLVSVLAAKLSRTDAKEIQRSLLAAALKNAEQSKEQLAAVLATPLTAVGAEVDYESIWPTSPFGSVGSPAQSFFANGNSAPRQDFFTSFDEQWNKLHGAFPDPATHLAFSTKVSVRYQAR